MKKVLGVMLKTLSFLFYLVCGACCFNSIAAPIWSNKSAQGNDYLVGTIHLGDNRFNVLPDAIKQAVDQVDIVVLELDLGALTPKQQQQLTLKYGLLPAGQTLATELSPQVYAKASQYLAGLGVNIEQFTAVKPWMLGLTMVQMAYIQQGLDANKGVDRQIYQYAKQQGKQIVGLETFAQQMQFFDHIISSNDAINSDDLILDTLNELQTHAQLPQQMVSAWLKADMASFDEIYKKTVGQTKFDLQAQKVLLTDRNKNWQQQLDGMLKQDKVLVAVGTLHFVGPYALQTLLSDRFIQL